MKSTIATMKNNTPASALPSLCFDIPAFQASSGGGHHHDLQRLPRVVCETATQGLKDAPPWNDLATSSPSEASYCYFVTETPREPHRPGPLLLGPTTAEG